MEPPTAIRKGTIDLAAIVHILRQLAAERTQLAEIKACGFDRPAYRIDPFLRYISGAVQDPEYRPRGSAGTVCILAAVDRKPS